MLFRVFGNSMEPYLKSGQHVIAFGKGKLNDVVVFKHPLTKLAMVKRIVEENEDGFYVKGDNQDSKFFVPRSDILGKVRLKF